MKGWYVEEKGEKVNHQEKKRAEETDRQTDRLPDLLENKNRNGTGGTIKLSLQ